MDIYIDESVLFSNPRDKDHYVCCLAGLIIPEVKKERIFDNYISTTSQWKANDEELKGSKLNESQASDIIAILSKHRVLVCVNAIDIGLHDEPQLNDWKRKQADKFVEQLTPKHHPNVVKELTKLRERFLALSNPLFVQAILLIDLVDLIIKTTTLYFCQRMAHTLKRFNWVIDAKDISITEYEEIWKLIVCPILQTKSFKEPLDCLEGGNYKYFERFNYPESEPPEYLKFLLIMINISVLQIFRR